MPTEVEIGGQTYRIGMLNGKEQFHIARRLAPVVAAYATTEGEVTQSLAKAVAGLSEDDCNYIMRQTLKVVQRKIGGDQWGAVWNMQADMPQFSDMAADVLLSLVLAVVQDQLGSFTSGLGGTGPQASTTVTSNARLN